ncbi:MAG: hypothetical protein JXP73_07765 [Deltaproteobacteria bacterium]|nr:hypothetical protein [Deltaproteobacteria bacterium]
MISTMGAKRRQTSAVAQALPAMRPRAKSPSLAARWFGPSTRDRGMWERWVGMVSGPRESGDREQLPGESQIGSSFLRNARRDYGSIRGLSAIARSYALIPTLGHIRRDEMSAEVPWADIRPAGLMGCGRPDRGGRAALEREVAWARATRRPARVALETVAVRGLYANLDCWCGPLGHGHATTAGPRWATSYLGMRTEIVDMTEIVRRMEDGIYDPEEFERSASWAKAYCRQRRTPIPRPSRPDASARTRNGLPRVGMHAEGDQAWIASP